MWSVPYKKSRVSPKRVHFSTTMQSAAGARGARRTGSRRPNNPVDDRKPNSTEFFCCPAVFPGTARRKASPVAPRWPSAKPACSEPAARCMPWTVKTPFCKRHRLPKANRLWRIEGQKLRTVEITSKHTIKRAGSHPAGPFCVQTLLLPSLQHKQFFSYPADGTDIVVRQILKRDLPVVNIMADRADIFLLRRFGIPASFAKRAARL